MDDVSDLLDYNWKKGSETKNSREDLINGIRIFFLLLFVAYLLPFLLIFRSRVYDPIMYFSMTSALGLILIAYGVLASLGRMASKQATMMAEGIGAGALAQNQSKDGSLPISAEKLVKFDGIFIIFLGFLVFFPSLLFTLKYSP